MAQAQAKLLSFLVDQLLKDSGPANDTAARQQAKAQMYSLAVRLMSSGLATGGRHLGDETTLVHSLCKELEAAGMGDRAVRVAEVCQRLSNSSKLSPNGRWATLQLLRQVAKDNALSSSNGGSAAFLQPRSSLGQLTQSTERGGLSSLAARPNSQGLPYTISYPASTDGSLLSAEPSATSLNGPRDTPGSQQQFGRAPASRRVSDEPHGGVAAAKEPTLVRDVLYACQGINGKLTEYSQHGDPTLLGWKRQHVSHGISNGLSDSGAYTDGFVVSAEADMSIEQRMLMARLTELGWLFRKVKSHIQFASSSGSAVRQALGEAFSAELTDFYRLMAILESHSKASIPIPGDSDEAAAAPYLTLRRLLPWLSEPTRRMRLLALMGDGTAGLVGGRLAGAVYEFSHHGDPFVAGYAGKVLNQVCVPLFEMIRRWVLEGELDDPHEEFFIAREALLGPAATPGQTDAWRHGYSLQPSKLPPFLSPALALAILRAGKGIHFLRDTCGDAAWVAERAAQVAGLVAAGASFGQVAALEQFVGEAAGAVDGRLTHVLFTKYHLRQHCEAVRRYLLLGQGDFVQALMDLVQGELSKPASEVSEVSLNHLLRQAVAASGAKYEEEGVMDRLRARRGKAVGAGEVGWDVFTLQYAVSGPVATVFTPSAMSSYLRVFQLLWRLKRVEAALASSWTLLQCEVERPLHKLGIHGRSAQAVGRRCMRLRNDMSHFVTNLQYYLMFEVLEGAWQAFLKSTASAGDLDALIASHESYLATLLRKSLLDEGCEGLQACLEALCSNMLALRGLVVRFHEQVSVAQTEYAAAGRRAKDALAKGGWGTTLTQAATQVLGVPQPVLAEVHALLDDLDARHRRGVAEFTEALPAQAHDEIRFLLFRLDFSGVRTGDDAGSEPPSPRT